MRIRWFAILVLLGAQTLQAQPGPVVGFSTGWVQATFTGKDLESAAYRPGFAVGASLRYPLHNWIALRPELWYEVKGGKQVKNAPFAPDGARVRISYVSLPLLMHGALPVGNGIARLLAGPQLSVRLHTKVNDQKANALFRAFDWGGVGGLELGFPLQRGLMQEVFLSGRYYLGLTKIDHTGAKSEDVKHRSFSLAVGVALR